MMFGILQRLSIADQSDQRLILRELPLLDWFIAFGLILTALILSIAEYWISAGLAGGIALYFLLQGRVRMVIFDVVREGFQITLQTPINKQVVHEEDLRHIVRAYLYRGDDDGTQIVLVRRDGEELGISGYSRDISPWKEEIVVAINAILYELRRDEPDHMTKE